MFQRLHNVLRYCVSRLLISLGLFAQRCSMFYISHRQGIRIAFYLIVAYLLCSAGFLLFVNSPDKYLQVSRRMTLVPTNVPPGVEQPLDYAMTSTQKVSQDHRPSDSWQEREAQLHGRLGLLPKGQPAWKPTPISFQMTEKQKVTSYTGYCFNSRMSDAISLDRAVPNYNDRRCTQQNYPTNLPSATVILIFYNELLSVLLRSVHSILNRTPPQLLHSILLVDDMSNSTTHPWLFQTLDDYVAWLPKTQVIHLTERHGLMGARMYGANHAEAPVLVFLDSHIEVTLNWLEPMLISIRDDYKTIVMPLIHTIHDDTFAFEKNFLGVLSFSWNFGAVGVSRNFTFEPLPSPAMAGGLFAVSKRWFDQLGQYDKELRIYGGEEIELSLKTWQCGGKLVAHPCSRVGHVFRSFKYWKKQVYPVRNTDIQRNKLRVAKVWLDEYNRVAEIIIGRLPATESLGPLDEAIAVRERNHCHSFSWYLSNVATTLHNPFFVKGNYAGVIQNSGVKACIDTFQDVSENTAVRLYWCHGEGATQVFVYEHTGVLRPVVKLEYCIVPSKDKVVFSSRCPSTSWRYDNNSTFVMLPETNPRQCLRASLSNQTNESASLVIAQCKDGDPYQDFKFTTLI